MSHRASVQVEFRNPETFESACKAMGWEWQGKGSHRQYNGCHEGLGVKIPGWRYPIVLQDSELIYDDASRYDTPFGVSYGHGRTADENGNVPEIIALRGEYAIQAAIAAATAQGLYSERTGSTLTIYLGADETITVTADGTVEANGFQGIGCSQPTMMIAAALGSKMDVQAKSNFYQEQQMLTIQE